MVMSSGVVVEDVGRRDGKGEVNDERKDWSEADCLEWAVLRVCLHSFQLLSVPVKSISRTITSRHSAFAQCCEYRAPWVSEEHE